MASRHLDLQYGLGPDCVHVSGSFKPNGTGTPVVVDGRGFTVARTGVGAFRVTFADKFPALRSFLSSLRLADATPTLLLGRDVSLSSKTADLQILQAATGTATLTLPAGNVMLPLAEARSITSNNIPLSTGDGAFGSSNPSDIAAGGILTSDSVPSLSRVNGATDKQTRVTWAATEVVPVQWSAVMPSDFDNTANATVTLLLAKGGNTDTEAVVGVSCFNGVGDTSFGGNTAALDAATYAAKTVTLSAADLPAAGGVLTIEVTPGKHDNDAIYCYGAYISYTRKTWAASGTAHVFAAADVALDVDSTVNFDAIFENSKVS